MQRLALEIILGLAFAFVPTVGVVRLLELALSLVTIYAVFWFGFAAACFVIGLGWAFYSAIASSLFSTPPRNSSG